MSLETLKPKVAELIEKAQSGGGTELADSIIEGTVTSLKTDATKIGRYAFYNNTVLTEVDFPEVTSIGNSAFNGCTSLKKVAFPKMGYFGSDSCFKGCTNLSDVNMPDITNIPNHGLNNCSITHAHFEKVNSVGTGAFQNCLNLVSVYLPKLISVGIAAFSGCEKLTKFIFYKKPTTLNSNAFNNCPNLLDIYVPWAEGEVAGSPWGAQNAQIHYSHNAEV